MMLDNVHISLYLHRQLKLYSISILNPKILIIKKLDKNRNNYYNTI